MRDLVRNIGAILALSPAVLAATSKGNAIDRKGFESVTFVISTGAIVGSGNFTVTVQESDTTTDGDFTDAAAGDVIGSNLVNPLSADAAFKIGYRGHKRYSRVVLTKNSGTSIAAGAVAILGHANSRPVA
ncbi:hypothetical protein [Gellertiella hungarica]|uniref:Uncharacterized protein n=1 Tax=Gellertiella hungarica TaxID=1572859 RepID=A0A7W6J4P9_9HYPH|nr:hypothetical protein [Gellertiella hungarica]MBB4064738.1 hypothetical protein [Gellertiella hungarica]